MSPDRAASIARRIVDPTERRLALGRLGIAAVRPIAGMDSGRGDGRGYGYGFGRGRGAGYGNGYGNGNGNGNGDEKTPA